MERLLTAEQWALSAPQKPRGRKRAADQKTLEGILWVHKTGSRWPDLPREVGSTTRGPRRYKEWPEHGVEERAFQTFLATLDEGGGSSGRGPFWLPPSSPPKGGRDGGAHPTGQGEQGHACRGRARPALRCAGGERPAERGQAGGGSGAAGEGAPAGGWPRTRPPGGGGGPGVGQCCPPEKAVGEGHHAVYPPPEEGQTPAGEEAGPRGRPAERGGGADLCLAGWIPAAGGKVGEESPYLPGLPPVGLLSYPTEGYSG